MRKLIFLATIMMALNVFGAELQPKYFWNFNQPKHIEKKANKTPYYEAANIAATNNYPPSRFWNWTKAGGWKKTGAVLCKQQDKPKFFFMQNINWPEATVELKFKIKKLPEKKAGLFGYVKSSWNRRQFKIGLIRQRGETRLFVKVTPHDNTIPECMNLKMFYLVGPAYNFKTGVWYTARVTTKSGGDMKIFLNNKLYTMDSNALSFSDLKGKPAKWYPLGAIGFSAYQPEGGSYFDGIIDDVKLWDRVIENPGFKEAALGEPSREDPNLLVKYIADQPPVINGLPDDACWKQAEWSTPFIVPPYENPKVLGSYLEPDPKFVKSAAKAAMLYDDRNLYVTVKCPIPAGMKINCKTKEHDNTSIWKDDNVEFFLLPAKSKSYYQLLINAINTYAELKCSQSVMDINWNPKITVKTALNDKEYSIEFALPFESMGQQTPQSGTVWRGNIIREGNTAGENARSFWTTPGNSNHDNAAFGKFIFNNRKAYFERRLAIAQQAIQKAIESPVSKAEKKHRQVVFKKVEEQFNKLKNIIVKQGNSPLAWDNLQTSFENLNRNILSLSLAGRNTLIWQSKELWNKFRQNSPIPADVKPLKTLSIQAPMGCRVLKSFIVSNLASKPYMGRFLLLKEGEKIHWVNKGSKDQTIKELAKHITYKSTLFTESRGGKITAEALMDMPMGCVLQVAPKSNMPVWLEIDTTGMKPGKYSAELKLLPSYSGFPREVINLELDVFDIDLAMIEGLQWSYVDSSAATNLWFMKNLVKYGINTLYVLPSRIGIFPKLDKNGNILELNFSALDTRIDTCVKAGIPLDKLNIVMWLCFDMGDRHLPWKRKIQAKFLSEPWKKGFSAWLKALVNHLKTKGIGYDRFVLYIEDESHGDPKVKNTSAYIDIETARFIKSVDPNILTMSNMGTKADNLKYLPEYFKFHDILEPHNPRLSPNVISMLKSSGKRIWTYSCHSSKGSSPAIYRNWSWINLSHGFESPVPFWHYDQHAGGDGLNSYDSFYGRGKRYTDYGAALTDYVTKQQLPSLRLEAWYQGQLDYKMVKYCRNLISTLKAKGIDTNTYQTELNTLIEETKGATISKMDDTRLKLLKMATEMKSKLVK